MPQDVAVDSGGGGGIANILVADRTWQPKENANIHSHTHTHADSHTLVHCNDKQIA